jgi:tetratricopeptide (TPR) repeat protein
MMKKIYLILCVMMVFIIGCGKTGNLFSFTHKAGGYDDAVSLCADAASAFEAGDYAKAQELYYRAIQADPTSYKARVGYVQAYIRNSGLDLISMAQNAANQKSIGILVKGFPTLSQEKQVSSSSGYWLFKPDPAVDYGISLSEIEGIYTVIIEHFTPIANDQTEIKGANIPSIIFINLSFAHLLRGIIRIVDKDENGKVDYVVWRNNNTNEYEFYHTDYYNSIGGGTPDSSHKITSAEDIITQEMEQNALADLDSAITYLIRAIDNSPEKDAKVWNDVRNVLNQARNSIDELK